MNRGIFKACDIRGTYPGEIDEESVRLIGRAVATIVGGGRVVVGGDVRLSTPALKAALIGGLAESGCDVVDIGIVPTPAFYFARQALGVEPGVMVTASHNPSDYNGLKITLGPLPITEEDILRIRDLATGGQLKSGKGQVEAEDVLPGYEEHLMSLAGAHLGSVARLPRIVIDCGNGCYSGIAPRVFARLGLPFAPLFCEADGAFPNRSPNSAVAANLSALRERVVAEGADLGVAFDGDGDRLSVVDETGEVLTPDQLISVVAKHMPQTIGAGDVVVLDQKCSQSVADVVREIGGEPVMEKSGHTFIKRRMTSPPGQARFGGEISGHLFYRELGGGDDGLYSAIVMARIVGREGSLSKLVARLPRYATTPEIRARVEPDPRLLERIAGAFPPERISRLDGVRVRFDDGWALARLSVTEPVITLRFEGMDEAALARVIEEFLREAPEIAEEVRTALRVARQ